MIQDTSPSPEMYLAKRSDGRCGGWGLTEDILNAENFNYSDLRENAVVWAVSVPAESAWVTTELDGTPNDDVSRPIAPKTHSHKFPIPGAPHIGVQVKVGATFSAYES
jgi:hypothetical protein